MNIIFNVLCFWIAWLRLVESHDLLNILKRLPYYDKEEIPTHNESRPTVVTIQMYIEGLTSFRAQSNDFGVDIYFQETWMDKRLAHNASKRILIKDRASFDKIWHPDIYFANARTAEFHDVTSPNFLVWLYPNGTLFYDCRISLTVICMLNLARYPLDSQSCNLRILSYAYDVDQLMLRWSDGTPIDINPEIKMPDMRLRKLEHASRNDTYATGIWSCALVIFKIDRELMHHIIQTYIPSGLIVTISFFSFWLDVDSVPGRVSLSITTILTVATQNSAAKMALPQASDLKAIDIWMGVCLTFVFSTMIEFTVVNFCVRRKPRENLKKYDTRLNLGEQVQRLIYANQKMTDFGSPVHQQNCRTMYFEDPRIESADENKSDAPTSPTTTFISKEKNSIFRRVGNGYTVERPTLVSVLNGTEDWRRGQRLTRTKKKAEERMLRAEENLLNGTEDWRRGQRLTRTKKKAEERMLRAEENRKIAQAIDRKSRIYFPVAFLVFNIVYWTYYLRRNPDAE
uniref:Uncharacterized protein n=1 Tax=Panagrolaimus sp. JU765 TaxID=591449 RepID=A0AC34QWA8_9BILA